MKSKIVIIGPDSTHVDRFIGLIISRYDDVVYIGETRLKTRHAIRQHIISFRTSNPFAIKKGQRKLKKIITVENPNHIHIQQVNRVAFFASHVLRSLGRKFVVTAWGSDVLVIPKKNFFFRWMTKRVLKRAAFITADSNDMINAIQKLAPGKRTELILFGITPIGGKQKEKIIYSNRALFNLYNINGVLDEFFEFKKSNPEWRLIIAGTGPQENELKMKATNTEFFDSINFCGWLNEEENFENYRKAAIYISLPFSDGTSVSLLEAMSAGCIPVLSDLPVSHEWIQNGVNGVIKSKKENCLSAALKLDQPEVASLNAKIISERATTETAAEKFHKIYSDISGA